MEKNQQLWQRLQELERKDRFRQWQMAQLRQEVAELVQKLSRNSRNSSLPPSANPLSAPAALSKEPTGRKIGGQRGHQGFHRSLLPGEQVDEFIEHVPRICEHCRCFLSQHDKELVARHQVMELPLRAVRVTEHQSYACRCRRCGSTTKASIPASVRCSVAGERLSAACCLLSSRLHGSRRAAAELLSEVLGAPVALGSVTAREKELSVALQQPYAQLQQHVQKAPVKHVDETRWRRAGRWLWVAATKEAAVFLVSQARNRPALKQLLGETLQGLLCTDRFGLYDRLPTDQRQVCWSHLKRDFRFFLEHPSSKHAQRLGERGLKLIKQLFDHWHAFKVARIDRAHLQQRLQRLRKKMQELLTWGKRRCGPDYGGRGFCKNLLQLDEALWRFGWVADLEPTNNHAERMLRPAVQWRKKSLGSHSQQGCRFVERMLSAIHTLRLQNRSVIDYLAQTLRASRQDKPALSLLPQTIHSSTAIAA
jgi:transposase